jgi:pimeloyl-ACP methyl ester carboxylesterase
VLPQYVSDMVTLIARLNVEQVDWFGTSMGGLIGIGLAGLAKSPVRKLLLNDVGPRITAQSMERIGAYLGLPVRFKTFEEGWPICRRSAHHSAVILRAVARAEWRDPETGAGRRGAGVGLHYDPALAVPFKDATPEAMQAGEPRCGRCSRPFKGRRWSCAARSPTC